jgi:hypothetical protein
MSKETIEVHFLHPRASSNTLTADVSLECTREQAIQGLLEGDDNGPFLEPPPPGRPYELVIKRSQKVIQPNMTFEQAGAVDGDIVEVQQAGQGAGAYGQFPAEKQE